MKESSLPVLPADWASAIGANMSFSSLADADQSAETGQLAGIKLIRAGLARMVAGVRTAVGIAAIASALIGMGRPLSWWWLTPALTGVALWTAFYVMTAWTRGLRARLIGVDVFLACLMCLAIGELVPVAAVSGTSSWVSNVAAISVVSAQLAGKPLASIPAGLLVAASLAAGEATTGAVGGGIFAGLILSAQTVIAALVMAAAMRGERAAVRAFSSLEAEQTAAALSAASREDERAQLRLVHSGPVTTLTMALQADARRFSPVLRQRAAAALHDLLQMADPPEADNGLVRLDERLAQVVVWYESQVKITSTLVPCLVAPDIAEAFTKAVGEALENIVRYARTDRAQLELTDAERGGHGRAVVVHITDQGRGFDTGQASTFGFGVREDVLGRMAAIGGTATINSKLGAGTKVSLEWHSGQPGAAQ